MGSTTETSIELAEAPTDSAVDQDSLYERISAEFSAPMARLAATMAARTTVIPSMASQGATPAMRSVGWSNIMAPDAAFDYFNP